MFLTWFFMSPLRFIFGLFGSLLLLLLIIIGCTVVLAFTGGPAPCTPGGGPITVSAANAGTLDTKWDDFTRSLSGGSAGSVNFNESEISSFVDREVGDPFSDPRVCIHDGYGEGTATFSVLGFDAKIKVKGNMTLSGAGTSGSPRPAAPARARSRRPRTPALPACRCSPSPAHGRR